MSQGNKSAYWRALKEAGVTFDKHYRDYSLNDLRTAYEKLAADPPEGVTVPAVEIEPPKDTPPAKPDDVAELRDQLTGLAAMVAKLANVVAGAQSPAQQPAPTAPTAPADTPKPAPKMPLLDPTEHAGVTMNTHGPDEPIRVDEHGNVWYRNEVQKPGYAKPRGRRILRAMDSGTVTETITTKDGYTETFEVPGDPKFAKPIEIKVTLPSYQTGIYKPKNMPFRVHTYQGVRGFDFDDVNKFYGGVDLVPSTIKRCYVSSDLCYDITSTIRAIEDEYRERVLKKETLR